MAMDLSNKQIKKIEDFSADYYGSLDYLHGKDHLNRTIKIAEHISKLESGNQKIVRLGAFIHQFHDHEERLIKFLKEIKVDERTIEKLINIVRYRPHRPGIPKSKIIEEKIVYDADALQVLGPFGTLRLFAERINKHDNLAKTVNEIKEVQEKIFKNLQTKTARTLAKNPHKMVNMFLNLFNDENMGKY